MNDDRYIGYSGLYYCQGRAIETLLAEVLYRYKVRPIKSSEGEYLYSVDGELYQIIEIQLDKNEFGNPLKRKVYRAFFKHIASNTLAIGSGLEKSKNS